ncbi:hypothetical protein OTU49_001853, partial [Cherax quadricarinatus]
QHTSYDLPLATALCNQTVTDPHVSLHSPAHLTKLALIRDQRMSAPSGKLTGGDQEETEGVPRRAPAIPVQDHASSTSPDHHHHHHHDPPPRYSTIGPSWSLTHQGEAPLGSSGTLTPASATPNP